MRTCAGCGCSDRAVELADGIEHWVKTEVRYVACPEKVTPMLQARGWQYKFFQGKHGMVRLACVDCIRKSRESDRMSADHKKMGMQAERKGQENYYEMLVT
jgi:hypothetical protein